MRACAIFKVVPGLVGIPAVIAGAAIGSTPLLVVGFVFLGVYVAEMAVVTPVVMARRASAPPREEED